MPKLVRQIKGLERFVITCMYKYHQRITSKDVEDKQKLKSFPTFIDILNDPETPNLKDVLSHKFGLISKNHQQNVIIDGHSYTIPKI